MEKSIAVTPSHSETATASPSPYVLTDQFPALEIPIESAATAAKGKRIIY